jgi:8-oxo-dGTP pyrophosphatase MutT (NUDIX family)
MTVARISARVVLLDDDGAVLLLCGSDPAFTDGTAPRWWFTVGGQIQPGEQLAEAAVRELDEGRGRSAPDRSHTLAATG